MAHKTKATGGGRQWENTKHKPEHHSDLLAGGQCVRFAPMTLGLTEGHYGECAGLLVDCQPFGTIPRCCNSLRRTRLIQVAKDVSPSALAASSSCALKSSGNRIWYGGERFSNGVDMVITLHYYTYMVITIVLAITQKSTPRSAGNTYGASNQQRKLGAVMVAVNHIPHLVHTQTAFVWRFLALSAGESQIIHVTAWTEREARSRCPSGCVAVFAARIRQGVGL